jgi:hypothetical protein
MVGPNSRSQELIVVSVKELENMSQEEKVLQHLREYDTITPKESMLQLGIQRLAPRVHRLRKRGHKIATEQDGPHDYATYRLIEEAD